MSILNLFIDLLAYLMKKGYVNPFLSGAQKITPLSQTGTIGLYIDLDGQVRPAKKLNLGCY